MESTRERPRGPLPTPVSAALILVVALLVGDLVVVRWIAPALLRTSGMGQLKEAINRIALILYVSALLAGLCSGLGAGWLGRRLNQSRLATLIGVLIGGALVLGVLLGYAWASKQPVPVRATEANAVSIGAGAFLGWLLVALIPGGHGSAARSSPLPSVMQVLSAMLLTTQSLSGVGTLSAGSAPSSVSPPLSQSHDIDASNCERTSVMETASGDIYLFGIDVGGTWAYREVRHPATTASNSDQWEAEVTAGIQAGLRLGVGAHIGQKLLQGTPFGEGLSLDLSSLGELTRVNVYTLPNQATADNTVRWQLEGYLTDSLVLPTLSQFLRPSETPDTIGVNFQTQAPKRTDLELGGKLTLSVSGGAGLALYSLDLNLGTAAGVRLYAPTSPSPSPGPVPIASTQTTDQPSLWIQNPESVELYLRLDGELDGEAALALADLGGVAAGSLEMGIKLKPTAGPDVWTPTDLTVSADVALAAKGGIGLSSDQLSGLSSALGQGADSTFLSPLKSAELKSNGSLGGRLAIDRSLSFENHPEDLALFTSWFAAFERAIKSDATAADRQTLDQLSVRLGNAIGNHSTYDALGYLTVAGETSFDVELGDFLANGARGSVSLSHEILLAAAFKDSGQPWQISTTCIPLALSG